MPTSNTGRLEVALVCVSLVVAVVASVGAPLITSVATTLHVPLEAAQWTLTVTMFTAAIAGPLLGRLGAGPLRRRTILVSLAVVALGGALTTLPLPFILLLIGRGLQGLGLAIVPLLISVARDHMPKDGYVSTVAALSVASTVGIGVGFPLIGLIDQLAGLRAAYGFGLTLSIAALIVAWRFLPKDAPGTLPRVDLPGAILLGLGTLGVLVVIAAPSVWDHLWVGTSIAISALLLLIAWGLIETRVPAPLVDVRLLRQAPVLRANIAMLLAAIGLYLLFSLLVRYFQTPSGAGYGFALPGILAGAALVPFSALGFVAGRTAPSLISRISAPWAYVASTFAVMAAAAIFAVGADSLVLTLTAMAALGFGVGGIAAFMSQLVLSGVPNTETASVMTIHYILRSIGFSVGSALAGLLLAIATPPGSLLPRSDGYVTATVWSMLPLAVSALIIIIGSRRWRVR